jgi:hypothetical protein
MLKSSLVAAIAVTTLAGCYYSPAEDPPAIPAAAAVPAADVTLSPTSDDTPPTIIPVPEVPTVAPPIEGSSQTREPFLYSPGATAPSGGFGLPLNSGPVTGYGPGGLAQPPGVPPNPPSHYR